MGRISLEYAKRSDHLMRATTSLTVGEFEELAKRFAVSWADLRAAQTAAGAERQRRPGAGPKGCLATAEQKLFFILLYFKAYPTQDVMGLLFGITQGQVSQWVRPLTAVAGQLLPLHRPARQARQLAQLLAEQPELREVIIDGTERKLPRPQHRGRQLCASVAASHHLSNSLLLLAVQPASQKQLPRLHSGPSSPTPAPKPTAASMRSTLPQKLA